MPFENAPDPRFFFATDDHEEALATLRYCVMQRKGCAVITGEPVCGKTFVSHLLIDALGPDCRPAMLTYTPSDPHELVCMLCRGFDVRFRFSQSLFELIDRLYVALEAQLREGLYPVAIIDEAQNLSPDLLEHMRMLGNMSCGVGYLMPLVLLGQPELGSMLQTPEVTQFRQRVSCVRRIAPLDERQTAAYIEHRLTAAGARQPGLILAQASSLIHTAARGLPRMINQIADNALLCAYGAGLTSVPPEIVRETIKTMMSFPPGEVATGFSADGRQDFIAWRERGPLEKTEWRARHDTRAPAQQAGRAGADLFPRTLPAGPARLAALEGFEAPPDRIIRRSAHADAAAALADVRSLNESIAQSLRRSLGTCPQTPEQALHSV